MRVIYLALAIVPACTEPPATDSLHPLVRLGTLDKCGTGDPSPCGDWVDGFELAFGPQGTTAPGVFGMRIAREHSARLTGATIMIDPMSVCTVKTEPQCTSGICFAELSQPELGLCMTTVIGVEGTTGVDACWFMGTFAPPGPSAEMKQYIESQDCGGTAGAW